MAMERSTASTVSSLEMACAQALLQLKYGIQLEPSQASSPPQEMDEEGSASARNLTLFKPTVTSSPCKLAAKGLNNHQKNSPTAVPTLTPSQIERMQEQIYVLQSQIQSQQAEISRLRLKHKKHLIDDSDEECEVERKRNKNNANKSKVEIEVSKEEVQSGFNDQEANDTEDNEDLKDNSNCSETKNVLKDQNLNNNLMVPIGDGYAKVPAKLLRKLNWSSYTSVTRKLLTAVFPRSVLATHSLTGKPSPAFPNKPAKKKLDPNVVNDIVQIVAEKCHVAENMIRTSITTKCADESKMLRTREQNQKKKSKKIKRENIQPTMSDSDE